MEYGIQLYSVRDVAKESLEQAVMQVADLGYKKMEFAGFFDHSAESVRQMLEKYDVELFGTHSSFDDLVRDFDNTLAYHKAIGNRNYIIPAYKLPSQTALDAFIDAAGPISKKLEKEGINLCFHNHAKEFLPTEDGAQVYDQLLYRTNLMLEVDAYWAYVGMKDPVKLLERVKNRVMAIHIKDGFADGKGMPLGMGEAPVEAMWQWAKENKLPMIVESETLTPDGATEAKICIEYLRLLEQKNK